MYIDQGNLRKESRGKYLTSLIKQIHLGDDCNQEREEFYADYFTNTFLKELTIVQQNSPLDNPDTELLVLLVGESMEPIMMSIGVWKPKNVLLVLARTYAGSGTPTTKYMEIKQSMEMCFSGNAGEGCVSKICNEIDNNTIVDCLDDDTPDSVYEWLSKNIPIEEVNPSDAHVRSNVIIDITGGKKSMVVGAFLYAAYHDARISYVDFEEGRYDTTIQRAMGCDSIVKELKNPYSVFYIRDWEQIKECYESYRFDEAKRLLKSISVHTKEQIKEKVNLLYRVLNGYDMWNSQNYHEARNIFNGIGENYPYFSRNMPSILVGGDFLLKPDEIYNQINTGKDVTDRNLQRKTLKDNQRAYQYIMNEKARVDRLAHIAKDYRNAFVATANLIDILLVTIEIRILKNNVMTIEKRNKDIIKKITGKVGVDEIIDLDFENRIEIFNLLMPDEKEDHRSYSINCRSSGSSDTKNIKISPNIGEINGNLSICSNKNLLHNIRKVRNLAVHGTVPVDEKIYNIAEKSLAEIIGIYKEHYTGMDLPLPELKTEAISWAELYNNCGLKDIPGVRSV